MSVLGRGLYLAAHLNNCWWLTSSQQQKTAIRSNHLPRQGCPRSGPWTNCGLLTDYRWPPACVLKIMLIVARHSIHTNKLCISPIYLTMAAHCSKRDGTETRERKTSIVILDHICCDLLPSCYCNAPKSTTAPQCARSVITFRCSTVFHICV